MTQPAQSPRKRRYVERPDVRATLLEAAEALIREEGYAAATARRVATEAGLKHQAIFYYFGSQDELLLEVFRRFAKANRERLQQALDSAHPVTVLWDVIRDPDVTRLTLEFMALANHNELIRAEIAKDAEEVRNLEAAAIGRHLEQRGIAPRLSPQLVSILTNAMARLLVQEATLGITVGHAEAEALVNASFQNFETTGTANADVAPIVDALAN